MVMELHSSVDLLTREGGLQAQQVLALEAEVMRMEMAGRKAQQQHASLQQVGGTYTVHRELSKARFAERCSVDFRYHPGLA
jgi:hypothetical protein